MRLSMREAYQSRSPCAVMPSMKFPKAVSSCPEAFVEAFGDLLDVERPARTRDATRATYSDGSSCKETNSD